MKRIDVFVADDGRRFDDQDACAKYDTLVARCLELERALLVPRPENDGCRFDNGRGYVQQRADALKRLRLAVVAMVREQSPIYFADQERRDPGIDWTTVHVSWLQRIVDGSVPCVDRLLWRLNCVDEKGREWGQPYYTAHPEQAELCAAVTA